MSTLKWIFIITGTLAIVSVLYYILNKKMFGGSSTDGLPRETQAKRCIQSQGMQGHKLCFEERDGTYWRVQYIDNVEVKDEFSPSVMSKEEYDEIVTDNPNW